jgi:hypothetical protein
VRGVPQELFKAVGSGAAQFGYRTRSRPEIKVGPDFRAQAIGSLRKALFCIANGHISFPVPQGSIEQLWILIGFMFPLSSKSSN